MCEYFSHTCSLEIRRCSSHSTGRSYLTAFFIATALMSFAIVRFAKLRTQMLPYSEIKRCSSHSFAGCSVKLRNRLIHRYSIDVDRSSVLRKAAHTAALSIIWRDQYAPVTCSFEEPRTCATGAYRSHFLRLLLWKPIAWLSPSKWHPLRAWQPKG
jgi:hypothetical protein